MWILFKQFFKTFKKNFFLILGLTSLMMVLSFLVSTCINVSISFATALDDLDNKGNRSNVVSKVPNDFGFLDFSYPTQANLPDPYYVYDSSLTLQYDPTTGKFDRAANTFYPYNKDKLLARKSNFGIDTGITVNPGYVDLSTMFIFDENNPNASWNYDFGLTVGEPISFSFNKYLAISYSFVDSNGQVLFNPSNILFNSYGIPFSFFNHGTLNNNSKLTWTFNKWNKAVFNKIPNIYDANGLGITTDFFNRCIDKDKPYFLHNSTKDNSLDPFDYRIWSKTDDFIFDIYSHFIKPIQVNPYVITFDLDKSAGPIRYYLQRHPEVFEEAFNKIFYANTLSRPNVPGQASLAPNQKIHSNIELHKNNNTYEIWLGINDEDMLVDYNEIKLTPGPNIKNDLNAQIQNQVNINKKSYINNFLGYLSSEFTNTIKDIFLKQVQEEFKKNDIQINKQSEYYYLDSKTKTEYLFVSKANNGYDDIVIEEGNNLTNSTEVEEIKYLLNHKVNNQLSSDTFYGLNKLISLCKSKFPEKPKTIPKTLKSDSSSFLWFNLLQFCSNKVVEQLDNLGGRNKILDNSVINSPYFLILLKLLVEFSVKFNGNVIEPTFILKKSYTTLYEEKKIYCDIISNYFCVINSAYAYANDKKHLLTSNKQEVINEWTKEISNLEKLDKNQQIVEFTKWIKQIKNTNTMILSRDSIFNFFNQHVDFFKIWLEYLPQEYKIIYQNNVFLINGFGLSPEYAYPSISPTSPIPTPENQAIVYLNESTYNSLDVSDVNKFNYLTYGSKNKNEKEIINYIQNYSKQTLNSNFFQPSDINDAEYMYQIWIRTYFPLQIKNLIIIFSVIGSVVLILLSIIVVYLLLKSFIKNMLEPISLCMGNGVPLYKMIIACMMNLGIITTFSTMISYIVAYFTQAPIISIFSSIWLVPNTVVLPFTPAIFLPLIFITFLVFSGLLSLIIYRKFKKPIPEIIANKQDIKTNKITNILRNNKLKLPGLVKLTVGYSSINIGRIVLLSLLGSVALGGIVSSSIIKEKFQNSKYLTNQANQYNYKYDFIDINESTGLLKPQKFSEMGQEKPEIGINSIYVDKRPAAAGAQIPDDWYKNNLPYWKEELKLRKMVQHGNECDAKPYEYDPNATNQEDKYHYLSNMIFPSWNTYNYIVFHKMDSLFNGVASIFLLDLPVQFLVTKLNIWEFVKGNFPTWVVTQLESQAQLFQNAIMDYYGEWYFQFIEVLKESQLLNNNTNNLVIENANRTRDSGFYYAEANDNGKKYYTRPYYLWVDSNEWFWNKEVTNNQHRQEISSNQTAKFSADLSKDFYDLSPNEKLDRSSDPCNNPTPPSNLPKPVQIPTTATINWKFVPAYNNYHEMSETKVSSGNNTNPYKIKFSDEFIKFITTIYADERVAKHDSKISFGIVPYDETVNEGFTGVRAHINSLIDSLGRSYVPTEPNVDILGIKQNSHYAILKEDGKNISNLLTPSNSNVINLIINNGASLKYGLDVGDSFDAKILNNAYDKSFNVLSDLINIKPKNPINLTYRFKVVGINDDSFGDKFYINQADANRILGLDTLRYCSDINLTTPTNNLSWVKWDNPTNKNPVIPFNGMFSKEENLLISNNSLPFYTFANLWTIWTRTNQIINLDNLNIVYDTLLTNNKEILINVANEIKAKLDPNFTYSDPNNPRPEILQFILSNYAGSSFLRTMNDVNQKDLLQSAINICVPTNTTNQMFDMISNLATTLIIIIAAIIIPLLFIVTLITSLSIVNDLMKNIGLMKILGFSNRNIILSFVLIYSIVLLITILLGLGIMFACTYGLQYLVFNLTTIFITGYVQAGTFFIGVLASVIIFALTILFISFILKRKGLENSIKF